MHQVPHLLPVAVALHRRGHGVRVLAFDAPSLEFTRSKLQAYGPDTPGAALIAPGRAERTVAAMSGRAGLRKTFRLIEQSRVLADADALIVSERTTSILRRLRLFRGPIIHIPHGAGDRAVGYDPRIALYDFHVVAGVKDRDRFVAAGLASAERVAVSGYVKLAAIAALGDCHTPLFADSKPVVLYNPHFDRVLGSFDAIGLELIDRIAARRDLNLIVAPHASLSARLPGDVGRAITGREAPHVRVDLGSARSCDMTYTRAADIYVGDVSSQIYEFEIDPRPAVFINASGARWEDDPHFSMWRMGRVVAADAGAVMTAIDAARFDHSRYRAEQRRLVEQSLGDDWEHAPERAADSILKFIKELR